MLTPGRRWSLVALVASLGFNLFLAGMILGRVGGGPFFNGHPPPPSPDGFIERIADRLPPADAEIVRKAMSTHRESMDQDMERRRRFGDRVRQALMAEPFDADALGTVIAEEDAAEQESRLRFTKSLVGIARALSPEGRRQLATFRP